MIWYLIVFALCLPLGLLLTFIEKKFGFGWALGGLFLWLVFCMAYWTSLSLSGVLQ